MFQVTTKNLYDLKKDENGAIIYDDDFFGKQASLTVSGQLEGELAATALGAIYTFGPTFRAENSNTPRHLAVLVYILMGAIGIPVFSGFTGGIGILAGTTGGYIVGFLFSALLMWGMEKLFGKDTKVLAGSMILGLAVCYAVGTLWFMAVYAASSGAVGIFTVLGWCVFPFIIPDIAKIVLALILTKRLSGVIRR